MSSPLLQDRQLKAAKMVLDTIKRRDELKVAFGDRFQEHID